jgi:hypothetical protein
MATTDTKTRRLSVNAAFLKDIKDDNRDLKILLDRIGPLAEHQQTATNHWAELIGLFSDLCDQLALHFSLEEAFGYFDDAIMTAPQLSVSAELLRGQHSHMFVQIRGLADRALEISPERFAESRTTRCRRGSSRPFGKCSRQPVPTCPLGDSSCSATYG